MTDFVIDEDLPRSTAQALSAADHRVKDIRDHGFATGARMGTMYGAIRPPRDWRCA